MDKLKERLQKENQEQILRFYDELSQQEQKALREQIEALDLEMIRRAFESRGIEADGEIAPIRTLIKEEIAAQQDKFYQTGLAALQEGKLAAVLLAGGQGSRLGFEGPKGKFNVGITKELYLFEILIRNMEESVRQSGKLIPMYIMTSDLNHEETVAFFEEKNYFGYPADYIHFFKQDMAPSLDHEGRIMLEEKGKISLTPNGNGGWFSSLQRCGLLEEIKAQGIEWLNVFSVDNVLQKIGDPVFLGATLCEGHAAGAKVIAKVSPDEKVGAICLRGGRPSVVEYSELTEEMRNAVDEEGQYLYHYGVTLNYLFRIAETEAGAKELPMHLANKKISCIDENGYKIQPQEPNGYKLETFIFDILSCYDEITVFEVVREDEFAPIKNKCGDDSPETARALLVNKTGIQL